jgi:uncharacterized membrane protein YdfJ with MMPL/SSD domain
MPSAGEHNTIQKALDGLSDVIARRRWWVLAAWAIIFIAAAPFSLKQTEHLTHGGYVAPRSQSDLVDEDLHRFPAAMSGNEGILLQEQRASADTLSAVASDVRRLAVTVPHISVPGLSAIALRYLQQANRDLIPISINGGWNTRIDAATRLREILDTDLRSSDGVTAVLVGEDALWATLQGVQKEQLASAERVGFPIALVILLGIFGAFAAAVLPLALGAVSVTLTGAVIYFLSQQMAMTVFVTNAASMVGIGVAIDYSLFVLARYRQEIGRGCDRDAARRTALRTSGLAVAFSGVTLIVSLLGIFLIDSATLRSMAIGMIVVVTFSILGAVTLMPALIALLGDRVCARSRAIDWVASVARKARTVVPSRFRREQPADFWTRWSNRVMRRPALSALGASALMLTFAIPALSMHIDNSAVGQLPKDNPARIATQIVTGMVGAGTLNPIEEIVTFRRGNVNAAPNREAVASYVAALRRRPQILGVVSQLGSDQAQVLLTIVPDSGVEAPATYDLLKSLRGELKGTNASGAIAHAAVGGNSALLFDFNGLVSRSMWKIAIFVIIVGYIILLVMLRSVFLPVKAVSMTLLSVAAAYGVLVAVFQWGWLDGLFGYRSPGYVDSFAPPLLLAVTFGLSMDYEVFMLARIREYYGDDRDDRRAIAHGLRSTAATITGAALIMVSVFAIFATVGADAVKQIGFGEAVAVGFDASVVRLILVPATMCLLGRWNWWLPRLLAERLPGLAFDQIAATSVTYRA